MKKRTFNPTPGDWRVDRNDCIFSKFVTSKKLSDSAYETIAIIAEVEYGTKADNIRLLTAAKEMYHVLSCIKGALERCNCEKCIDCDTERMIDRILAKVEGTNDIIDQD